MPRQKHRIARNSADRSRAQRPPCCRSLSRYTHSLASFALLHVSSLRLRFLLRTPAASVPHFHSWTTSLRSPATPESRLILASSIRSTSSFGTLSLNIAGYKSTKQIQRGMFPQPRSITRKNADAIAEQPAQLFKELTNGADDAIARHARDANGDNKERNHPFPRRTASPNPMSAFRSRLAPCLSASSNVCLCALGGRGFSFSGNAEVHRLPSAH